MKIVGAQPSERGATDSTATVIFALGPAIAVDLPPLRGDFHSVGGVRSTLR
jgi:hypothetical protein